MAHLDDGFHQLYHLGTAGSEQNVVAGDGWLLLVSFIGCNDGRECQQDVVFVSGFWLFCDDDFAVVVFPNSGINTSISFPLIVW
jgi:hypothetical protein